MSSRNSNCEKNSTILPVFSNCETPCDSHNNSRFIEIMQKIFSVDDTEKIKEKKNVYGLQNNKSKRLQPISSKSQAKSQNIKENYIKEMQKVKKLRSSIEQQMHCQKGQDFNIEDRFDQLNKLLSVKYNNTMSNNQLTSAQNLKNKKKQLENLQLENKKKFDEYQFSQLEQDLQAHKKYRMGQEMNQLIGLAKQSGKVKAFETFQKMKNNQTLENNQSVNTINSQTMSFNTTQQFFQMNQTYYPNYAYTQSLLNNSNYKLKKNCINRLSLTHHSKPKTQKMQQNAHLKRLDVLLQSNIEQLIAKQQLYKERNLISKIFQQQLHEKYKNLLQLKL